MSQSYADVNGVVYIPGGYSSVTVASAPSGLSTNGVVTLIGEADGGGDWSTEADLTIGWGPDQLTNVKNKYISGPIVDAFASVVSPSNDPQITGAVTKVIIVKTNVAGRASLALQKIGGGTYGKLWDLGYGALGNLIYSAVTATSEVVPTTGAFTWLLPIASLNADLRANGAGASSFTVSALTTPAALVSQLNGLAGTPVAASGGTSRGLLGGVVGQLAVAVVSGNQVTITYSGGTWGTTPTAGDTVYIPTGSAIVGAANANRGSYVVQSATATIITCTKLMDASGSPGALTAPVAVSATNVLATTDVQGWAPVTVALAAANPIDGVGKTLEINALTSGTDLLTNCAYALGTSKVTWISTTATPVVLTSGTEYSVSLADNRQFDNKSEIITAGGSVALKMGYTGTTAVVTINATTLSTTVTGGTGANLSIQLSQFKTLNDLAAYIAAQTGYTCSVATLTLGQLPPSALDQVTSAGICTDFGAATGRIKVDAYKFFQAVSTNSILATFSAGASAPTSTVPGTQAAAGLPATLSNAFFSGGSRGGTSDSQFNSAVDALQTLKTNFIVPLISADATTDIADGLTDSTSTYTRANVHAYTKSHVLLMSSFKRRRERLALLSDHDSFTNCCNQAATIASARCGMTFQDVKNPQASATTGLASGLNSGTPGLIQFRPWMAAVLAAGMQAAGGYKGIVMKQANCSGVLVYDKSYNDGLQTNVETALQSGLMPMRNVPKEDGGGIIFGSDQMTYGADSNFVYNSLQAMYVADLVSGTSRLRMEKMFAGQSLADISAPLALSAFEGIMKDMIRLKYIASSDDAILGYKNLSIRLVQGAMVVKAEIKLATLNYWVIINFVVSQVTQTAGTV